MGRSWLIVGRNIPETEDLVKESFEYDLDDIFTFLSWVTDCRTSASTLMRFQGKEATFTPYFALSELKDDIPTLIQFPALLGLSWRDDETIEWAKLFAPRRKEGGDGRYSPNYNMRVSFDEIRTLRDAGVPLAYAQAMDRLERRYPVAYVIEAWTAGLALEFALAL